MAEAVVVEVMMANEGWIWTEYMGMERMPYLDIQTTDRNEQHIKIKAKR